MPLRKKVKKGLVRITRLFASIPPRINEAPTISVSINLAVS